MENILSEYDKSPGIISPDFEKMDLHLPKRAVFAFLGEKRIERFVLARGGEKAGTFVSLTKDFPLWMIKADKEELCILQAPAGACAAYRGKVFAQILFTADTLHDLSHEQRAWGKESHDKALLMGVKAAERL